MKNIDPNVSYSVGSFMEKALVGSGKVLVHQEEYALCKIATFLAKTERDNPETEAFREQYAISSYSVLPNVVSILEMMGVSIEYGTEYLYLVWNGRKFYKPFFE